MANTFKLKTKANVGVTTASVYVAPSSTTTVVVEPGTTYTGVVVTPTLAFVFSLKVFAICDYPNAIARATTSSSDAPPPPPPPPPEALTTVIPVAPTVAVILLLKFSVVAIPAAVPLF